MTTDDERPDERRAVERVFVQRFVERTRRERMHHLLGHPKGRTKLRARLAHDLERDLDPRWMFDETALDASGRRRLERLEARFRRERPDGTCYAISENSDLDGRFVSYEEACHQRRGSGLLLVLLAGNLALYWPEDPGGPYVLMRDDPDAPAVRGPP
jgi:hypothetical protein